MAIEKVNANGGYLHSDAPEARSDSLRPVNVLDAHFQPTGGEDSRNGHKDGCKGRDLGDGVCSGRELPCFREVVLVQLMLEQTALGKITKHLFPPSFKVPVDSEA